MARGRGGVEELQGMCGLPVKVCQAALKKFDGDVEAALAGLIDEGKVTSELLDPDTVADELFGRAAHREQVEMYRRMLDPEQGLAMMFGKAMTKGTPLKGRKKLVKLFAGMLAEDFGGKTAEEMVAEGERGQTKRDIRSAGKQAKVLAKARRRREALEKKPRTLKLAPFPPLKITVYEWTGKDVLKAWKGTQERHGPYTSRSSRRASTGTVELQIPRLDDDDANPRPPSREQVGAYAYLKENQFEVTQRIMEALVAYYTKLRKTWLRNNPRLDDLPVIESVEEMRKNVGLGRLHMFSVAKGGVAYIGLEMGCTWDEEHGVGVLLHKGRMVDVGQADTSLNDWTAKEDGGKLVAGVKK